MEQKILKRIETSLIELDIENVKQSCQKALEANIDPFQILDKALVPGLNEVGNRYQSSEYFLAELILAGEIMKEATQIIEPYMKSHKLKMPRKSLGKVVVGTVKGDLHDIGKNIFASLLKANNFEVYDLGIDVSPGKFVEEVSRKKPDILAMSALLTNTMLEMKGVIKALEKAGLRSKLKVIIGGSPVTDHFAEEIGADAASNDAVKGVKICKSWLEREP